MPVVLFQKRVDDERNAARIKYEAGESIPNPDTLAWICSARPATIEVPRNAKAYALTITSSVKIPTRVPKPAPPSEKRVFKLRTVERKQCRDR